MDVCDNIFYMLGVFDDDNIFVNHLVGKNDEIWGKIGHENLTNFNATLCYI